MKRTLLYPLLVLLCTLRACEHPAAATSDALLPVSSHVACETPCRFAAFALLRIIVQPASIEDTEQAWYTGVATHLLGKAVLLPTTVGHALRTCDHTVAGVLDMPDGASIAGKGRPSEIDYAVYRRRRVARMLLADRQVYIDVMGQAVCALWGMCISVYMLYTAVVYMRMCVSRSLAGHRIVHTIPLLLLCLPAIYLSWAYMVLDRPTEPMQGMPVLEDSVVLEGAFARECTMYHDAIISVRRSRVAYIRLLSLGLCQYPWRILCWLHPWDHTLLDTLLCQAGDYALGYIARRAHVADDQVVVFASLRHIAYTLVTNIVLLYGVVKVVHHGGTWLVEAVLGVRNVEGRLARILRSSYRIRVAYGILHVLMLRRLHSYVYSWVSALGARW